MPEHLSNIPFDKNASISSIRRNVIKKAFKAEGKPIVQKNYDSKTTYNFVQNLKEIQKTQFN